MEKRQLITPAAKDDTPLQIAKALSAAAEKSLLNTEVAIAAHRALAGELAAHADAIQAIAEAVKPKSKTIHVTVMDRDDSGRPSHYKIELK